MTMMTSVGTPLAPAKGSPGARWARGAVKGAPRARRQHHRVKLPGLVRLRAVALGDDREDDTRTSTRTSKRSAVSTPALHAPHEETLREKVLSRKRRAESNPPVHAPHEETLREKMLGRAYTRPLLSST